jgi:hypothetical protein
LMRISERMAATTRKIRIRLRITRSIVALSLRLGLLHAHEHPKLAEAIPDEWLACPSPDEPQRY